MDVLTPQQRAQRVIDTTHAIGLATLGGVLLSQIEVADSLGRSQGFRRSLL